MTDVLSEITLCSKNSLQKADALLWSGYIYAEKQLSYQTRLSDAESANGVLCLQICEPAFTYRGWTNCVSITDFFFFNSTTGRVLDDTFVLKKMRERPQVRACKTLCKNTHIVENKACIT